MRTKHLFVDKPKRRLFRVTPVHRSDAVSRDHLIERAGVLDSHHWPEPRHYVIHCSEVVQRPLFLSVAWNTSRHRGDIRILNSRYFE